MNTWSIIWAIEGRTFLTLTTIQCFASLPGLAVPQIIGELSTFFEDESIDVSYGIYLSLGLLAIGVLRVELQAFVFSMASRVLSRVKALVSYVIYYKAVHVSINADDQLTTGQKITLLAADSQMVAVALAFEPLFISMFLLMFLICAFLHIEIGISALAGWMFVLVVSFPIQSVVGGKIMSSWKAYIGESDKRYCDTVCSPTMCSLLNMYLFYRLLLVVNQGEIH